MNTNDTTKCQLCGGELETVEDLQGGGKVTQCTKCGHRHAEGAGDLPAGGSRHA